MSESTPESGIIRASEAWSLLLKHNGAMFDSMYTMSIGHNVALYYVLLCSLELE